MLIGLSGFKRSGKDTLGKALHEEYGFVRVAFADALRHEVACFDGIARPPDATKDVRGDDGLSYRDHLIARGQARRREDPDYWVKSLDAVAAPLLASRSVVVTDVRFENEIAWVHDHGGLMVWVYRDGVVSNGHVTERDWLDQCDVSVENALGDPADMARYVFAACRGVVSHRSDADRAAIVRVA